MTSPAPDPGSPGRVGIGPAGGGRLARWGRRAIGAVIGAALGLVAAGWVFPPATIGARPASSNDPAVAPAADDGHDHDHEQGREHGHEHGHEHGDGHDSQDAHAHAAHDDDRGHDHAHDGHAHDGDAHAHAAEPPPGLMPPEGAQAWPHAVLLGAVVLFVLAAVLAPISRRLRGDDPPEPRAAAHH